MPDIRRITFVSLSCVLLFGTIYSVAYHTYLDTSDPLVALARVPHPLAESSYFARKDNILNTLFIKKAWGWTTAVFVALLLTAPTPQGSSRRTMSLRERLGKWAAATGVWLLFVVWFFGPGVMERVMSLSGAECVLRVPSGDVPHCTRRVLLFEHHRVARDASGTIPHFTCRASRGEFRLENASANDARARCVWARLPRHNERAVPSRHGPTLSQHPKRQTVSRASLRSLRDECLDAHLDVVTMHNGLIFPYAI